MPRFQNTLLKAASCEDASLSPEVFLLLAGEKFWLWRGWCCRLLNADRKKQIPLLPLAAGRGCWVFLVLTYLAVFL